MRRAKLKNKFKKLSGWSWASGDGSNPSDSEGNSNPSSSTADPSQQPGSLPERHRSNSPQRSPHGSPPPQPIPTEESAPPICQLWNTAYDNLREEDAGLIEDYETQLCGSLAAGLASTVSSKLNIRDRMATVLQHKMDEVNKDSWRLKFGSSEVQVKNLVQPVLGAINFANEYIADAMGANPYASLAWAGVSLLLPLFLNPTDQGASLAQGLEYISNLIARSRMWEDLYARRYESKTPQQELSLPSHAAYRDGLEKLYRQILKFQTMSYCYYSRHAAFRFGLDMIKWNEWDTMIGEIRDQERVFADLRDIWRDMKYDEECEKLESRHRETAQRWQAIGIDVSGLRKAIEDAQAETKRGELLSWLCASDHSEMYNAARDLHESGTGDWLVRDGQAFKTWKEYPGSLLWLHGKPGSGKSILSSSVVKHLQEQCAADPETALAYFFFSFSDSKKQSVAEMLASLVKQLCASRPDTPEPVKSLGEYKDKGGRPDTRTLEASLLATVRGFSAVFVVLDALDECPTLNKERTKLLNSLGRVIAAMPGNLHILCTSRPEADIKAAMGAILSPPQRVAVDLTEDRDGLNHDIDLYIDMTLASADYSFWPDELKADAKTLLIGKADGIAAAQDDVEKLQLRYYAPLNWARHLEMVPRMLWPAEVVDAAARALEIHSNSLRLAMDATIDWYISAEERERMLQRPLCFTAQHGFLQLTDMLLCGGPGANSCLTQEDLDVTLQYAANGRSEAAVQLLLDRGANVNARCGRFGTALQTACANWKGGKHMVPLLLEKGADVSIQGGEYGNALQAACRYQPSLDTIELLLARGADVNAPGGKYGSAISAAAGAPVNGPRIIELLVRSGADVNQQGGKYGNALQAACAVKEIDNVRALLDHGADVNTEGGWYGTALQAAAWHAAVANDGVLNLELLQLLLDHGADVNVGAGTYGFPLQSACAAGRVEGVEFLLDNCPDIDVNAQGEKFGTALQAAAQSGKVRSIELLLKRGADVNARGGEHGSALNAAVVRNHWDTVEVLLDHGAEPRLPEMDGEWLAWIDKEYGPGAVERYNKFKEAHQQV